MPFPCFAIPKTPLRRNLGLNERISLCRFGLLQASGVYTVITEVLLVANARRIEYELIMRQQPVQAKVYIQQKEKGTTATSEADLSRTTSRGSSANNSGEDQR